MKLTVSSQELHDALRLVKRSAAGSTTMPVLENVLVEKQKNSVLLKTTDLETSMVERLPVRMETKMGLSDSIADTDTAVLPLKKIANTVENMGDIPVEIVVDDEQDIRLETEKGTYEMKGDNPDDFPDFPKIDTGNRMSTAGLKAALNKVGFAVSNDALRPAMQGVFMDAEQDVVVATDGHRLSKVEFEVPLSDSVILMEEGVSIMTRVMDDESTLFVGEDKDYALLKNGNTKVFSRLVEESYPDYEAVIPKENDLEMVVDRDMLSSSVERTSIYTDGEMSEAVQLNIESDQVQVIGQDIERSAQGEETIPCEFNGDEPMTIAFNGGYLKELLKVFDAEEVKFSLDSPNNAGIVEPIGEEGHTALLMPVIV